jgi:hypothetical protein
MYKLWGWGRSYERSPITGLVFLCGLQAATYVGSNIKRKGAFGLCSVPITESPESLPANCRHSGVAATTHLLAGVLRWARRYLTLIFCSV